MTIQDDEIVRAVLSSFEIKSIVLAITLVLWFLAPLFYLFVIHWEFYYASKLSLKEVWETVEEEKPGG